MSSPVPYQKKFFEELSKLLNPSQSISVWLSELLDIDQSNAYRRIRGEKELSFSEYCRICESTPVAVSWIQSSFQKQSLVFGSLSHFKSWRGLKDYLRKLVIFFEDVLKANHNLSYAARDLPLFFFYSSPALMQYKFDVWLRGTGHCKDFKVPRDVLELGTALFEAYKRLNTVELWYFWSFLNQLEQINYWRGMDYISDTQVIDICDSLDNTLWEYEQWLEVGKKSGGGKLSIGILEFCTMNNGSLIRTSEKNILMNGFQAANFFTTTNKHAIELFLNHWKQHESFSQSVTKGNTKYRHRYFKRLRGAISDLRHYNILPTERESQQ